MKHLRFPLGLLLLLMLLALLRPLSAHDLQTGIEWKAPFVVLHANYEGQEPASFLSVTVHPPASAQVKADAFQTGRTDFHGRFVFQPSVPGEWRVVVDDEMGHRVELVAAVAALEAPTGTPQSPMNAAATGDGRNTPGGRSTTDRLLIGLSILFGAAGLLYGWTARKRTGHAA
jgi:nickel transport protein